MDRMVTARLNSGMDSCVRVLNLMRRKGIIINKFSMDEEMLYLDVDPKVFETVQLNLQTLSDVSLIS
ncbi:MAG: hypothetical protein GXY89_03495 [Tissierellia bacterium]|jgi:hypothetical protein|nr:hypothetical protein [Tissierellia bacterium]NLW42187.1 hypothetical protein [Tissierellia bacterium]